MDALFGCTVPGFAGPIAAGALSTAGGTSAHSTTTPAPAPTEEKWVLENGAAKTLADIPRRLTDRNNGLIHLPKKA
jgi:hypothetical protein